MLYNVCHFNVNHVTEDFCSHIHETYSLTITSFTLYRYFMLLATASTSSMQRPLMTINDNVSFVKISSTDINGHVFSGTS